MSVKNVDKFIQACYDASSEYKLVSKDTGYKEMLVFDCRAPDGVRIDLIRIPDLLKEAQEAGKDWKELFAEKLLDKFNAVVDQFTETEDGEFVRATAQEQAGEDVGITPQDLLELAQKLGLVG